MNDGQSKLIRILGTSEYNNVGCGLQDKAGNLWFGTKGEGLYCYDGKSFTNFTEKDGLSSNFIWSALEDDTGKLWFGTADGISCYDGKKFTVISITAITGS
ncbi:MAG TPA: two-component regulator propeller domain-containing protein, partial [Nitrosopumilaceae archaeon]|nr:two-component regulator propeller domain-containing protein [Nitrosopumilaceae archaeon]